jgi:FimV-like protein
MILLTYLGSKSVRRILYGFLLLALLIPSQLSYSARSYYGPTLENEHLYRIASRVRPKNVTIEQTMIALLNANPGAFANHNINSLKAGYRLRLPRLIAIYKIKPEFALRVVHEQNLVWRKNYSIKAPAKQVATKNKAHKNVAASKVKKHSGPVLDPVVSDKPVKDLSITKSKALDQSNQQVEKSSPISSAPQASKNVENQDQTKMSALNEKIDNLIAETKKFEQQASAQLATFENQHKALEAKVGELNEELKAVTYHFIQLNGNMKHRGIPLLVENIRANAVPLGTGFICLIIISYLLARSFRTKPVDNKSEEYDFLNSNESVPNKLDLARAYIDMGDFLSAKGILKEVLIKGTEEQQQGANDLLLRMNQAL